MSYATGLTLELGYSCTPELRVEDDTVVFDRDVVELELRFVGPQGVQVAQELITKLEEVVYNLTHHQHAKDRMVAESGKE